MIDFSFEKDIIKYQSAWKNWKWSTLNHKSPDVSSLDIHGFYGCGKREFIRQLVLRNKDISYFSFRGLNNCCALSLFCEQILDNSQATDWHAAAKHYKMLYSDKFHLLILDTDKGNEVYNSFRSALNHVGKLNRTLVACIISEAPKIMRKPGSIAPRSLADFFKAIPAFDKSTIVRLHGLTGGIPAVAKELDASLSYEDNLNRLLHHGSAFSDFFPNIMSRMFRSPESYHPLMYQIALGKHRLSEIAKEIGFPNNKCGKYLEALMNAGLVEAVKEKPNGFARYYLTNTYLYSWYCYIYKNQALQIMNPQMIIDQVIKTIDKRIAVPALRNSCIRYISNQVRKDQYSLFGDYVKGFTKPVRLKHKDGFKLKFDCVIRDGYRSLLCVFPRSLDDKYTKDEMKYYIQAAKTYGSLEDDVTLFIFSMHRFSDWCVHQAAMNEQLFCVPIERLKY